VGVNFSWNDLSEDADVVAHPNGALGGVVVFAKGDRLNLSPEETAGATADYQFPIGSSGYKGHVSGAVSFVSSQYYRRLVGTGVDTTPGENITIGRIAASAVSPGGHWTTSLYVDDVNNQQNAVFLHWTDVPQRNLYVRPRTFGLQVEYKLR
jgi:iron complex outermembrane receptor protein